MLAKKILAGIFAVTILIKLLTGLINPHLWSSTAEAMLGHQFLVIIITAGLLLLTGYYVFASFALVDLAVAMFFTSLLMTLSLLPYTADLLKGQKEIFSPGVGKAWLAFLVWGILAVAVLYKIFSPGANQPPKG